MLPLFLNTLVKHGHIAPGYRLQNHIRTYLSHRDAPTRMQRGSGGGERLSENQPILISGSCPEADPSLSSFPSWSNSQFFTIFFVGKSKFVKPQKSDVWPLSEYFFSVGMHTDVTIWFLHDLLFDRAALWRPTPWARLWHSPAHQKHTWEVTSLAYFCLVVDITQLGNKCHYMFAYRCVLCIMSQCKKTVGLHT